MCVIEREREAEDGWILAKFFSFVFMDREEVNILTSLAYVSHLDCQSEHMIPFILPTDAASDTLTLGNFIIGSLLSRVL